MSDQKTKAFSLDLLLLDPALTAEETQQGCARALTLDLASAVVKPCFVRQAADVLRGSAVTLATVIGYPYGANAARIKLAEAKRALTEGAQELLIWCNLGLFKAGDLDAFRSDLAGVIGLAHMNGATVRVALAMDHLSGSELQNALVQAQHAGADGAAAVYGTDGHQDTWNDLQALLAVTDVGVIGGIRSESDLDILREMGCTRIGLPADLLDELLQA